MEKKATLIDVRTPEEFHGGHAPQSINIPLMEIPHRLEELKAMSGKLIFCCASGNRSGQAVYFLKNEGFDNVENGGSWIEMMNFSNQY
jgi:phage shock protein E